MRPSRRPSPGSRRLSAWTVRLGFVAAAALSPQIVRGDAPPAPNPSAKPAHVVETVHAWRDFARFAAEAAKLQDSAERKALAERTYLDGAQGRMRAYFSVRSGGDAAIAFGDWLALPAGAWTAVSRALADPSVAQALERDASDLARRFASYGAAGDTTVFVYLVGDFSNPYTTWNHGRTQFVAIQLETFVPAEWDAESKEAIDLAIVSRPDSLARLADVAPWAAYAATRQFVPELRERVGNESASLAEVALLNGFSSRFAAALYPQSVFGRGVGPLRQQTANALEPAWRRIGASWFPLGTKPYSAVRYEEAMTSPLPEGTSLDAAVSLVGAHVAEEWLRATRIGRTADEPGQITRQGRVPTLSAWALLQP